jgi:cysteine desulfurase
MIAMGKNVHESKQLFRISFGTSTTIEDIKAFTDCLKLLTTS